MQIFEWIGVGVLILICALATLFARREIIARGRGTIELSFRLTTLIAGRGWSPGIARFNGDELRWYRVFSFAPRPRRILSRRNLAFESRRVPDSPELMSLPGDWVVVRCTSNHAPVEIAMAEATLTGFLSWIEAAPPGGANVRLAAR
jgi:hypothetical protein